LLISALAYLAPEDLPVVPEADMAGLDGMLAASCTCSICFAVAACKQSCLDVATSTKGSVTGDECPEWCVCARHESVVVLLHFICDRAHTVT
jgi:hypothetical protein